MLTHKSSQRGAALLAFSMVLSIVAFTVVLGYSISSAKKQSVALVSNQVAYLNDVRSKLVAAYAANSLTIDADPSGVSLPTSEAVLAWAGVNPRWGIQAKISDRITKEDVKYRVLAAWLPMDSDVSDDPVLASDGSFTPCPVTVPHDCGGRRRYVVVSDGFAIQRNNAKIALTQLNQIAANAQSFFKSKTMLDPERNVSVNYFRPAYGGCTPIAEQLPCIDSPQPVYGINPPIQQSNTVQSMVELLGLANTPLLNPWGLPIEACNGAACNDVPWPGTSLVKSNPLTQGPPYSMLFQTSTPWGGIYRIYAVQQI